jgi:hypothetical protein
MDGGTMIRVLAGALAAVILAIIIWRRKNEAMR